MAQEELGFSIVLEELGKSSEEADVRLAADELQEYEEVRALREIVLELESPTQVYFTST